MTPFLLFSIDFKYWFNVESGSPGEMDFSVLSSISSPESAARWQTWFPITHGDFRICGNFPPRCFRQVPGKHLFLSPIYFQLVHKILICNYIPVPNVRNDETAWCSEQLCKTTIPYLKAPSLVSGGSFFWPSALPGTVMRAVGDEECATQTDVPRRDLDTKCGVNGASAETAPVEHTAHKTYDAFMNTSEIPKPQSR